MTSIYALIDPLTLQVRYVGKTRMSIQRRLANHIGSKKALHSSHWVHGLKDRGYYPNVIELESNLATDEWPEAEQFWIAYFRMIGADLTNYTKGGHHVIQTSAGLYRDESYHCIPDFDLIIERLCESPRVKRLNPAMRKLYRGILDSSSKTDDGLLSYEKTNPLAHTGLFSQIHRCGRTCYLATNSDKHVLSIRKSSGIQKCISERGKTKC